MVYSSEVYVYVKTVTYMPKRNKENRQLRILMNNFSPTGLISNKNRVDCMSEFWRG